MAAGRYAYNEIVAEPLTKENQEAWFVCVKNFLLARDLWEAVEGTTNLYENSVSWRRKNAEALHIMQISCTPESRSHIMKLSNAKVAWDILNNEYSDNPTMPPQEMEAEEVDSTAASLYRAICENNWSTIQAIVKDNPSTLSAKLTCSGSTALHVAALFGHVGMVEELVKLVSQDHLEIVNDAGETPLLNATYSRVTEVAKCMVNKNRRILSISTPGGHLPVSLAFAVGHKEMARYLYKVTPLEDLKPDKGTQGPRLLYYCFNSRNLDIALHLLQRCENLLFAKDSNGWTPIEGIAAMPCAFPSGSQLMFWKRWIYKCQ